jgi:hypothetical protein
MKNTRRRRKATSAEAIARLTDEGEDVSRFFTNTGRMMGPIQRVNGAGGIRTLVTGFGPHNGLANRRLQPLGHLSRRHTDCEPHPQRYEPRPKGLRLKRRLRADGKDSFRISGDCWGDRNAISGSSPTSL